jgi:hypothetical protein
MSTRALEKVRHDASDTAKNILKRIIAFSSEALVRI